MRDLSNYQARDATVDPVTGQVRITGVTGKGLGPAGLGVSHHKDRDTRSTAACGEEGPPPQGRIVGGEEEAEFFTVMAGAHNIGEFSEPHRVEIFSDNGIP